VARGRWIDRVITAGAVAGISLPTFWFGLLFQIVFATALGWLPSSGRTTPGGGDLIDHVQHLVMPATVLGIVLASGWSRYLRGSVIETLAHPFVLAARARGVPTGQVLVRHVLRNAAGPVLAVVMVDAALIVSGAIVTESVFAWPGLGSLFTEALARRDYSVLMAFVMLTSAVIVVLNIAADAAHATIDPRVAVT
jgi:peptide/nickel transport system permease protein